MASRLSDEELWEMVSSLSPAKMGASLIGVLALVKQVRDQTEQRVRRETLERVKAAFNRHYEYDWNGALTAANKILDKQLRRAAESEPKEATR